MRGYGIREWRAAAEYTYVKRRCAKTRYPTRREAEHAIAGMARRWRFTFKRPYRCGECRAYHVTSTPPLKARRKRW